MFARLLLIPLLLAGLALTSCRSLRAPAPEDGAGPAAGGGAAADGLVPAKDVAAVDKIFASSKSGGFLPAPGKTPVLTPQDTWFVIDLDAQRTYLYHQKKLIAASKISSGVKYYRTETGDYTLGQKDLNHRSTSYGNFVNSRGGTVMSDVQNGFDPTPAGARFQGALMKYFMRFHHNGKSTAMGFHRGALPGRPASHGCVRLPEQTAAWFFKNVPMHTPIYVRGKKLGIPYGASQGRPKRSPKVHSSLKKSRTPAAAAPSVPPAPEAEPGTPEPAVTPSPALSPAPAAVEPSAPPAEAGEAAAPPDGPSETDTDEQ